VDLTGVEIMYRVKRNKLIFAIIFIVLSFVELGQFSYAHHEQHAKPDHVPSITLTSKP
jgi:hypothetical protein